LPEYDGPAQKIGIKSFDDFEIKSESDDVLSFLPETIANKKIETFKGWRFCFKLSSIAPDKIL